MKNTLNVSSRQFLLLVGLLAGAICLGTQAKQLALGKDKPNPGIAPPQSKTHGMSYGEWSAAYWKWALGIPAAQNPILDETGEFAEIDQEGQVWFLAGNFGNDADNPFTERTITVPTGKSLFFPLVNYVYWAPDDLPLAITVAESLGFDPEEFSAEELLAILANYSLNELSELTLTIDGVQVQDLERYLTLSPGFTAGDTDLLDDFGVDPDGHELFVAAGYWIMLRPLSVGEHTIQIMATVDDSPLGLFTTDVTHHITVSPRKR
jgi:hypothetical protein